MVKKNRKRNIKHNVTTTNDDDNADTDTQQLMQVMGFSSFTSSKNKSHVDSDMWGTFKGKQMKRDYRQYMNKKGSFNKNFVKPMQNAK